MPLRTLLPFCLSIALAVSSSAQSNVIPGTDVRHGLLQNLTLTDHVGAFPNGMNALAMSTTSCNVGTTQVPWLSTDLSCGVGCGPSCAVMEDDHPYIAFLIARESGGRFEQISDQSWVKHGFFALADSQCTPCQGGSPFGTFLGIGCSDTYSQFNNGDDYWLGPAGEIDPWLGTWDPFGSFFDRGMPEVGAPQNNDGRRSWCNSAGVDSLGHRVHVSDADLATPGAEFYFQGYYVIRGEPEANRGNNGRSRRFVPSWTGVNWNLTTIGGTGEAGSILNRWNGATVSSGINGGDDGRVFVGMRVTGPEDGLYRYEVAVHNRDSHRKVGALRLPVCAQATVTGVEFRDIDREAQNDWAFARQAGELVWTCPRESQNAIQWNTLYNFSFQSDAAPVDGSVTYFAFDEGPGADSVVVSGLPLPLGLYNVALDTGCSFASPPSLVATGAPAQAILGNASFALESGGNDAGASVFGFAGFSDLALDLGGGCTFHPGGQLGVDLVVLGPVAADPTGSASVPLPIPDLPGLEGVELYVQAASERAGGGPVAGQYDLSDALLVRIGATQPGCP